MKKFFPSLINNTKTVFCENAGGTQIPEQVIKVVNKHIIHSNSQPNGYSLASKELDKNLKEVKNICSIIFNNKKGDFVFGSSTTQLVYNVANSLEKYLTHFKNGEIILNNFNHDSCITPFERIAQKNNYKINWWGLQDNFTIDYHTILMQININTKLVVLPHTSNILGNTIDLQYLSNEIKRINKDTLILVDGVAYMPHDVIDVEKYNIDFYIVSFYKFCGLRGTSVMYINNYNHLSSEIIENQNHYIFDNSDNASKKLELGGINFESIMSIIGIKDYFLDGALLYDNHEHIFTRELFVDLMNKLKLYEKEMIVLFREKIQKSKEIEIIECKYTKKSSIFSLRFKNYSVKNVALILNELGIICRNGTFYCDRFFHTYGVDEENGLLRISLFHYNTLSEVYKVVDALKLFEKKDLSFDFSIHYLGRDKIDFTNIKNSFNYMEADKFYDNKRNRAFSLLKINSNTSISLIGDLNFYQASSYNNYNGNKLRKYPNIDVELVNDKTFNRLVYVFLNKVNENYRKNNIFSFEEYVQVHQIRVYGKDSDTNLIPEGIHQDGFNIIGICCITRNNVIGAVNNIYDGDKNLIYSKQLEEGEIVIINDNKLFHEVTNMKLEDVEKEGYRDIFVFTTLG